MEILGTTNPYRQLNIEVKARVSDLEAVRRRAEEIASDGPSELDQHDTFFNSPNGRLKLRRMNEDSGELIYYERPDTSEPTESSYLHFSTDEPDHLHAVLTEALGIRGEVRKHRTVYTYEDQTRIHLDRVEQLGSFVELEVMMAMDQEREDGETVARQAMQKLDLSSDQLIGRAYIDLLEEQG